MRTAFRTTLGAIGSRSPSGYRDRVPRLPHRTDRSNGSAAVHIMVGGLGQSHLPAGVLTERWAVFRAQGMDVKLLSTPSGCNSGDQRCWPGRRAGVVGSRTTPRLPGQGPVLDQRSSSSRSLPGGRGGGDREGRRSGPRPEFRGRKLGIHSTLVQRLPQRSFSLPHPRTSLTCIYYPLLTFSPSSSISCSLLS